MKRKLLGIVIILLLGCPLCALIRRLPRSCTHKPRNLRYTNGLLEISRVDKLTEIEMISMTCLFYESTT